MAEARDVMLRILELYQPDPVRVALARQRVHAAMGDGGADYLPLILPAAPVPERERYPVYDLEEQFHAPDKMLAMHLWGLIGLARAAGDAALTVRPNFGTGFLLSVFGLKQQVFPDMMPWLTEHLSPQDVDTLTVDQEASLVPRALDYIAFFRQALGERAQVYIADTQGPFDLAHLALGNAFFTELYDAPERLHRLLERCTHIYIDASRAMKEAVGEPLDGGVHGPFFLQGAGVRACEDTTTLVSPEHVTQFSFPYLGRALAPFAGGWVHLCGRCHHFLDALVALPEVRALNFGNPEMYVYEDVMQRILAAGKCYMGSFPPLPHEDMTAYYRRILAPVRAARRGLVFVSAATDEVRADPQRALAVWHELQDEE